MNSHQESHSFLSHSYSTQDEFLKEYNKSYNDKEKSRQLYIQTLRELNVAVCEGNFKRFKNISQIFKYVTNTENAEELAICLDEDIYSFKNTNIIILACEYNRMEILKYIFSNYSSLYERLHNNENRKISPNDEDQDHHNAFYYSIRSGNTKLLNTLINEWPGNYFENRSSDLDEILSKAYKELKLNNVLLSESMEFFIEERLINLRFFSISSSKSESNKILLNNIINRIEIVNEQIESLNSIKEVDEEFLFILKYIALNIYTLKRRIKSSYDTLPWEEIEFILLCFISCNTEDKEINIFYRVVLTKFQMLKHLNNFAKRLSVVKDTIRNLKEISSLSSLPNINRERIVTQIINKYPEFEELYQDFQKIRNVYTLNEISNYVTLLSTADIRNQEGQLMIIRSLQAIGECLKNTLEAPKLSCNMSNLILLSLPKNTRKLVKNIRNSLSHAYSLTKRMEILQNEKFDFFDGIKNDILKIGTVIKGIFYENNLKTIKNILEGVVNCKNVDELKQIVSIGIQFKLSTFSNLLRPEEVHLTEHEKFKSIIQKLKNIIPNRAETKKAILQEMEEVISNQNIQHSNNLQNYVELRNLLITLKLTKYTNSADDNNFRITKYSCNAVLNNLQKNSVQPKDLKSLGELSIKLLNCCDLDQNYEEHHKIRKLIMEIFCIIDIQLDNVHWLNKLRDKLMECSYYNDEGRTIETSEIQQDKSKNQLTLKLLELKKILTEYGLSKSLINTTIKNNKRILAALEMLILEILSILGDFLNRLEDNLVFLDENIPLLIGKNLRNHLAHGNAILDIIPSNYIIALIVTAQKLVELDKNEKKIGISAIEDLQKLKSKIDVEKKIISIKLKMFNALETGDFESLKNCIAHGADVHARKNNTWTSIHAATKGGNLNMLKFLIDQMVDIQVKSIDGKNPLHTAAQFGNLSIVEFFLKRKYYNIDSTDESFKTPLHLAALNNHKDTVETLLKSNAKYSVKDVLGCSPLHYAIQENHKDVAEILLKKEKHVDSNEAKGGFTSLHIASERGHLELVIFLLNHGARVGAETDGKIIPLHLASLNGHTEVVDILVAKKSNVNARVHDGCTPLHYATEHGHKKIVDILLKNGADPNVFDRIYNNTPLHYAAQDGYVDIVEGLINYKANVDVVDVHNHTPLFYAISNGHLEIIKTISKHINSIKNVQYGFQLAILRGHFKVVDYLISLKMDVNITDDNGNTPLHVAAFKGFKDIVALLLKNKAKINAKNKQSSTPLLEAVGEDIDQIAYSPPGIYHELKKSHMYMDNIPKKSRSVEFTDGVVDKEEVVNILLQNGADINVKTNDGMSVLHLAALSGKYSIVKLLLSRNVPVNAKSSSDRTPLILATISGHKEVVLLLLANGADINCVDAFGCTALHAACIVGYCDIVKILLVNNANINAVDKTNSTPLFHAVNGNQIDVVKVLTTNQIQATVEEKDLLAAIKNNNSNILKILLDYKRLIMKSIVNKNIQEMNLLLHYAVLKSDINIIITLIENGADVNSKDNTPLNSTPLQIAVRKQREKIVKLLLEKGANVNCINNEGLTLLHTAAINGNPRIVEILLQYRIDANVKDYKKRTALQLAVAQGHLQMVELLLPRVKMNINSKVHTGFTILHIAVQWNHMEVIKYLVKNGADINIRNKGGSKPIHIAAREGFEEIVKYFLNLGQDINELGSGNTNLLHTCAPSSNLYLAEYLIKNGANVKARSHLGRTPLHTAARWSEKIEFIKLLLKHGAMYNATDNHGRQPIEFAINPEVINLFLSIDKLFTAVKQNNVKEVKKCIEAGVIVSALNADNVTSLHFASWKGYDEIVAELVKDKNVINVLGKSGFTALHYAAKFGHFNVCKILLAAGAIYNLRGANDKTPLDFSANEDITELLKMIENCFEKVSKKNISIISDLKKMKDETMVKALMNACNTDGKSLIAAAILNDFPKVEELKQVWQNDLSSKIKMAETMAMFERYDEALKVYELVLEKRSDLLGKNNPSTLDIQDKIATVLYKQQKYDEALNMLQDLYVKQRDLLGENSKEVLNTRSSMALILHRQGKNKTALAIFQQVYENQKNILTLNDKQFSDTHIHMALVLNALGKFDEALEMNTKVLEHCKKSVGSDNPETLVVRNNIAMVLTNQGKYEQAEEMYRKVYESRKKKLGTTHSDTLRAFHNIVTVLAEQKKYVEAMGAYEEVLKFQKSSLGSGHIDTLNTQLNMGKLLFEQGKYICAFNIFSTCMPEYKNKVGPSHVQVLLFEAMMEATKKQLKSWGQSSLIDMINNLNKEARDAVSSGDLQHVQHLLENDIYVNEADEDGRTLLHFAANSGNVDVARLLLNSGCILTIATKKGNTPLHTAVSKGHKEIVEEFLEYVNRAELPDFINAKTTDSGTTALHIAAKGGNYEIVQLLLKYGVEYSPKNNEGKTPLNLCQNQKVVDLLKLVDTCFNDVMIGNVEVIDKLREMGKDEFLAVTNARNDKSLKQIITAHKDQKFAKDFLTIMNKIT